VRDALLQYPPFPVSGIGKPANSIARCRCPENPLSAKRLAEGALEGTQDLHTVVLETNSLVQETYV
jgi:hypothetical protein